MSAQAPQSTDIRTRSGEEQRFREAVNRQVPRPGPGMVHTTVPGGTVLRPLVQRSRRVTDNLRVSVFSDDSQKKIRVSNGTIGGLTPTLDDGEALDASPAPSMDITGEDAEYVFAVVSGSVTVDDGFVRAVTVTGVDIQVANAVPDSDGTEHWTLLLATLQDGRVVRPQPWKTSIPIHFTDSGLADGTAIMLTGTIAF